MNLNQEKRKANDDDYDDDVVNNLKSQREKIKSHGAKQGKNTVTLMDTNNKTSENKKHKNNSQKKNCLIFF